MRRSEELLSYRIAEREFRSIRFILHLLDIGGIEAEAQRAIGAIKIESVFFLFNENLEIDSAFRLVCVDRLTMTSGKRTFALSRRSPHLQAVMPVI